MKLSSVLQGCFLIRYFIGFFSVAQWPWSNGLFTSDNCLPKIKGMSSGFTVASWKELMKLVGYCHKISRQAHPSCRCMYSYH